MMYLEVDRADARGRREIVADLHRVLADVRAAVTDWRAMQARMRADADEAGNEEGAALLRWFADGAMTLLGYEVERPDGQPTDTLGLFRIPGEPTDPGGALGAMRYFEAGRRRARCSPRPSAAPRSTAGCRSTSSSFRSSEGGKVTGIGVHAGLWTSEALSSPVEEVPLLRRRLQQLEREFGFDPSGHSGKALRHAVTALPHDLLVSLSVEAVRELVTTAMSLADRPRPTLALVRSILKGNMFAFVWLPRDELTTRRRLAIGKMIEQASQGRISNWSVELGDGDLALIRYTLYVGPETPTPDVAELDRRLDEMVRGWEPSVEEALGELVGPQRATRLALSYLDDFPEAYRIAVPPAEAAQDILRICALDSAAQRDARLYRQPDDGPKRLRLNTYRLAEIIPLSDAVPVFENFGFRVLEEHPTALDEGRLGYVHEFLLEVRAGEAAQVLERSELVERAIAEVLEGKAENDPFNQLLVAAALAPRDVVLFRAWFRYLRQGGLSYSMVTVVEALRRAPESPTASSPCSTRSTIPSTRAPREARGRGRRAGDPRRPLPGRRDRRGPDPAAAPRRRLGDPADQRLHPRRARGARLQARQRPGARTCPQPLPWREIWVYSPRVEGIHLRGGPIARGGLRWSDRRDDFRTEILGLMKAQLVKNAVIVPTGAKGGFYPKQLPPSSDRDAWLAEGHGELPDLHPRPALGHRQYRRQQGRPSRGRRRPRRRRSLFRRRRRQGHRDLLRRRQRDRDRARLLARRRLRLAAEATATTTRRWGSPPAAPGSRSSAISARSASTSRRSRSGSPESATCRATCSATACCCRRRSSWSPPSTTATSSSIPIPIRRRAGRSATGCSTCRARAGTITTAS